MICRGTGQNSLRECRGLLTLRTLMLASGAFATSVTLTNLQTQASPRTRPTKWSWVRWNDRQPGKLAPNCWIRCLISIWRASQFSYCFKPLDVELSLISLHHNGSRCLTSSSRWDQPAQPKTRVDVMQGFASSAQTCTSSTTTPQSAQHPVAGPMVPQTLQGDMPAAQGGGVEMAAAMAAKINAMLMAKGKLMVPPPLPGKVRGKGLMYLSLTLSWSWGITVQAFNPVLRVHLASHKRLKPQTRMVSLGGATCLWEQGEW